jgi:hypothetical protein
VKSRHMHRVVTRFPRTVDAAFNTPRYAASLERPAPRNPLARWAAWCAFAVFALIVIARAT